MISLLLHEKHCIYHIRNTSWISACTRGSPQYTLASKINSERPLTGCSTSSGCANEYQCTNIGSQNLCCPTPSSLFNSKHCFCKTSNHFLEKRNSFRCGMQRTWRTTIWFASAIRNISCGISNINRQRVNQV